MNYLNRQIYDYYRHGRIRLYTTYNLSRSRISTTLDMFLERMGEHLARNPPTLGTDQLPYWSGYVDPVSVEDGQKTSPGGQKSIHKGPKGRRDE